MEKFLENISSIVWGPPLLIFLLGTHVFLTFRLRFIQRYIVKGIKISLNYKKEGEGDISQFGALTTALAATIGTGNIIGWNNRGYVNRASGMATILNGNTSIVVTHGLADAVQGGLTPNRINVTGQHAEVVSVYVNTIGAANFTITNTVGATSANRNVYWEAFYKE